MKRVVFVDQTGDSIGGAERSLQLLLAHLRPDVDVTVVLFNDGIFARELREAGHHVVIAPMPQALLAIKRERLPLASALVTLRAVIALRRVFRELRADVVYTNTIKAHVLGSIAARSAGISCVVHLRDILEGRARAVVRTAIGLCSVRRIAISRAVERGYALKLTSVIPNPLDLAIYRSVPKSDAARAMLALPQGVPLVGVVGRINRWKGQDRFLRIAAVVAEQSAAHFVIVGAAIFRDVDFADELRSLAHELGIAERVHFVPWLDDPRLAYAALDVHCNTSEREPFGRTIIEAAAVGVPTVCFDDGGAEDAVAPALRDDVVTAGDNDAFARRILAYLHDAQRLRDAGEIARTHSATFDAALHARRVELLLSQVATHAHG